ncbi:MAG: hypothetical protein ACETWD_10250 [Desulfatiglandales bacterium]
MSKFYRSQCIQPVVLWVALLLVFSLSKPIIGSPEGLVRSGSVKIEGKTSDSIILAERHFIVTESTTILDVNGKKIQLTNLPVPCEAEIQYRLRMDQDPVTLKIVIKRVLPGSSTMWSTSTSE